MKRLVATAPRTAALLEYPDLEVKPNEVKIKVAYASPKHGTEVIDFRGASPFMGEYFSEEWRMFMPRARGDTAGVVFGEFALGNMIVGSIVEIGGDVTRYQPGDVVCSYAPICDTLIVNGVDNFRLRKLPDSVKWQNALCYDPAQFALGGVRDANVRAGDFVVVMGLGAIGQIAVQLASRAGASVVVGVDPLSYRREIALRHGAHYSLDPSACDLGYEIKKLTGKLGADAIIETSGNAGALQSALRGVAYGGTIAYVAFGKAFPAGLDLGREAHFNQAKLIFSRAASEPNSDHPRWNRRRIEDTCWQLLVSGYLDCEAIISPIVPFEDSAQAYMHYVDQHAELSIKMGVTFK
ncbi:zinc-binding alcohol dehydrogenase [Pseudomaricurvus alcaniphilus]|uniref:zinc-dependent alcohol dehydrogenase n=1 Tax=Pseudomaricurvus alcaniphilus TaxID=1166482 RepID=UPI00140B477D|nr:zinc-binding alcohol dehydrogenase [Pseudomaricurvus alcaniphilus]NHN36827.1 zinc-binding alcohol dehydrogenase [Pseudomaricurvus alcaniphilus]